VLGYRWLETGSELTHLKVDVSPAIGHGGQGDHAAPLPLLQAGQQQVGQQEVTQVVDPQLDAEAVLGAAVSHQACSDQAGEEAGRKAMRTDGRIGNEERC